VYLARRTPQGTLVALRVVRVRRPLSDEQLRDVRRDLDRWQGTIHPALLRLHDVLWLPGKIVLALEYAPGGSLQDRVREEWPIPWREAVTWVWRLGRALGAAHQRGFAHGHVHPGKVLFGEDDEVKLSGPVLHPLAGLDPDEARPRFDPRLTPYLAPERFTRRLDPRTDVYGLGAVLYNLLTGRPLFVGRTSLEIIRKIQSETPARLGRFREDLPGGLQAVVDRALAKDPDRRFKNPAELEAALARVALFDPELHRD
jgi:serine/threonine-protein kinase